MTNLSRIKKNIMALFLAVALLFSGQFFLPTNFARADEPAGYTDVLDDLKKSSSFNVDDYPFVIDDYTISVITIAESDFSELFIYTYQPSKSFVVTSMNMGLLNSDDGTDLEYKDYDLQLLNNNGVFYKYKVKDYTISSIDTRVYEIVNVRRPWDSNIDKDSGNDNIINEVKNGVGLRFTFYKENNENKLKVENIETIDITSEWLGFMKVEEGNWWWGYDIAYVHFVSFSTSYDDKILDLKEVSISYTFQKIYTKSLLSTSLTYGDITDVKSLSVIKDEPLEFTTSGLFKKTYNYPTIQTTEEFLKTNEFDKVVFEAGLANQVQSVRVTDASKNNLKNKKWVVNFLVTPFINEHSGKDLQFWEYEQTNVTKVSLLSLRFLDNKGNERHLGVIDNKTSADLLADNIVEFKWLLNDKFTKIMAIIAIVLIAVFVGPFISPIITVVLQFLGKIFGWLFRNIWKILTFPFRLFKRKSIPKTRKRKR